jgi:anti-sigma factor RsiW
LSLVDKETLTRYLLGELSPEDRGRLEKEYLANDELWESLTSAENDLIDSYVRGALPERERTQFEQHFLDSPERYEQVEMAKLLMDPAIRQSIKATPIEEHGRQGWRQGRLVAIAPHHAMRLGIGAAVACGLLLAVLTAFLVRQNRHLQAELGQIQSQQIVLQRHLEQLEHQTSNATAGETTSPKIVAALLTPGMVRQPGQEGGLLRIPDTASSVLLMLDLRRDQYRQYRVVIETPDGQRVIRVEGLTSQPGKNGGRIVSVALAPETLKRGDYLIILSGQNARGIIEVIDSYSLSVIR